MPDAEKVAASRRCITPGCTTVIPAVLNWCDDHDPYHDNPPLAPMPGVEKDASDWEARAVIAEAQVAALRDMFSHPRWLQFSTCALHQIRDRVNATLDSWERS